MRYCEQTVDREDFFCGKVFSVHRDSVRLHDGSSSFREVVEHSGGICIAAVDDERNIYLVEQYRYPFATQLLEVPAGRLNEGEDVMEAAARELSEETGIRAESLTNVGTYYSSPGYCSEKLHLYLATELIFGEQHTDEGEFLTLIKLPLSTAVEMVLTNAIVDGKTKTLILLADKLLSANGR